MSKALEVYNIFSKFSNIFENQKDGYLCIQAISDYHGVVLKFSRNKQDVEVQSYCDKRYNTITVSFDAGIFTGTDNKPDSITGSNNLEQFANTIKENIRDLYNLILENGFIGITAEFGIPNFIDVTCIDNKDADTSFYYALGSEHVSVCIKSQHTEILPYTTNSVMLDHCQFDPCSNKPEQLSVTGNTFMVLN